MVAQVEEVVEQQRQDVTQYSQPVPVQILTGVYLAGVLFPCLVTALTISREQSFKLALGLMVRQTIAAIGFASLLA
jgi:hypothetical protein